jgi:FlaA1/EpsC-like NDP-sugar epimerase
MPKTWKQVAMLIMDIFIILAAIFFSILLRLETYVPPQGEAWWLWVAAPVIAIPIFIRMGLYHAVIRYLGNDALEAVFKAVSLYAVVWGGLLLLLWGFGIHGIPRSVILINWLLTLMMVGSARMIARWWFTHAATSDGDNAGKDAKKVAIYGVGSAGIQLAQALFVSNELKPVAFIDDAASLHWRKVHGLKVYPSTHLDQLVAELHIDEVLLAIPSISPARRREILALLEPLPVHIRTLPGVSELAQGKVRIDDIREVSIDDLLGRDQVAPDQKLLRANIESKVVMVTGAGGSIGSELCRQIIQLSPKRLILFEQSEFNLYQIEHEILGAGGQCVAVLGSVVDRQRVELVCSKFHVQTIFHAAAYKHVPMVEKNPLMGVANNVLGTWRTAQAAMASRVDTFVLISTDKAVRPTNVMGATKRFTEMILQGLHCQQQRDIHCTRFTMVRFGNVLGSSGSVVPLFHRQIRSGGPVTVTHVEMIRYFMTIPEAAQLVIQAGSMGEGGDVFVLDMGEPVRIYDLARHMVRLSGLDVRDAGHPDGDIAIETTGLRPGEKLYEELLIGDNVMSTSHSRIMRAEEERLPWEQLKGYLNELENAVALNNAEMSREVLLEAVRGYKPQCDIEDVLFSRKEANEPEPMALSGSIQYMIK